MRRSCIIPCLYLCCSAEKRLFVITVRYFLWKIHLCPTTGIFRAVSLFSIGTAVACLLYKSSFPCWKAIESPCPSQKPSFFLPAREPTSTMFAPDAILWSSVNSHPIVIAVVNIWGGILIAKFKKYTFFFLHTFDSLSGVSTISAAVCLLTRTALLSYPGLRSDPPVQLHGEPGDHFLFRSITAGISAGTALTPTGTDAFSVPPIFKSNNCGPNHQKKNNCCSNKSRYVHRGHLHLLYSIVKFSAEKERL